jgi:PTH1 family peptidyl-tRNA hydrolase
MRNIIDIMGSSTIPRLRFGIDTPSRGAQPLPEYVLSPFADEEKPLLRDSLDRAEQAVTLWLRKDMNEVMGRFNAPTPNESKSTQAESDRSGSGENMEDRFD